MSTQSLAPIAGWRNTILSLLAWVFLAATTNFAAESANGLAGKVTRTDGDPIDNVIVRIVGDKQTYVPAYRSRGMVEAASDADGRYRAELKAEHLPLVANYQPKIQLAIWAPGFRLELRRFPATRLQADAPLDLALEQQNPCRLHVVNEAGEALADAVVSPAKILDYEFAYGELDFLEATTDKQGFVSLQGVDRDSLQSVYISSPAHGHQSLAVSPSPADQVLVAKLLPVRSQDTRLVMPDLPSNFQIDLEQVVVSFISRANEKSEDYVWDEVRADREGTLRDVLVTPGESSIRLDIPADFPLLADNTSVQSASGLQPIQLMQANLVRGRVVDSLSGDGIEGICIAQYSADWRLSFTDVDGRFSYWSPRKPHDGFFPQDPIGRYISSAAFYTRPEGLPDEAGVIQAPEQRLLPMARSLGTVVDAEGNPVAGAEVTVSHQKERFTYSIPLYTDAQGQFRLFHIPDGTLVELTARNETLRTAESLQVLADGESLPPLMMQPIVRRALVGRIVNQDGEPVIGARVVLKRFQVYVEENFNGEDRQDTPLFDDRVQVLTADDGRFRSPPTDLVSNEVAFEVHASGYRRYHSLWIDCSHIDEHANEVELASAAGSFQLQPEATLVKTAVRIAGDGKLPLANLRFIALGAHVGRTQYLPKGPEFEISLKNGPQILGVIADDHQPAFQLVEQIPAKLDFQLHPSTTPLQKNAPLGDDRERLAERRQLARRLMQHMEPVSASDTMFKRRLWFESTMYSNFPQALEAVESGRAEGFEMVLSPGYTPLSLEQIEALLPHVMIPEVSMALRTEAAKRCKDPAKASQLLDEVATQLEVLSGTQKASVVSRFACALLQLNQTQRAEQLLSETWNELTSLQDFVSQGKRDEESRQFRGVARYFAPELVLVDKRASFKLIELGAFAHEIPWLQSEAIVFLASEGKSGWELVAKAFLDGKIDPGGVQSFLRKTHFKNVSEGIKLSEMLASHTVAASLLLNIVERSTLVPESQKISLLEQILQRLKQAKFEPGDAHPAQLAAHAAGISYAIAPQLSDKFLFEALWLCEGTNSVLPFDTLCQLAAELVESRPEVARHLIAPCFDDWSWLYLARNSAPMFQHNRPLATAALIDSEWAVTLAEELLETHLQGMQSRRLATVHSIIDRWARDEVGMNP